MIPKKKTDEKSDPSSEADTHSSHPVKTRMVTEIVEVVEEIKDEEDNQTENELDTTKDTTEPLTEKNSETPPEFVSKDESTESPVTSVKEEPVEEVTKVSSEKPPVNSLTEEEKVEPKQVVEELFTKKEPEMLTDIAIEQQRSSLKPFVWALIVIVVALLTGSTLFMIVRKSPLSGIRSNTTVKTKPTPTTLLSTPVPTIALKREDITVDVLNGGGKAGAATKMKNLLIDKGYKVTHVGNANEYSYDQTQILVKSDKQAALNLLKSDLTGSYTLGTVSATLSSDNSADAQVIVGKD